MVDTFLFLFSLGVFSGQPRILFLWLQNMLGLSPASHSLYYKLSRKETPFQTNIPAGDFHFIYTVRSPVFGTLSSTISNFKT